MCRRRLSLFLAVALVLTSCGSSAAKRAASASASGRRAADGPGAKGPATVDQPASCDWPMAGQNLARTHASGCTSADAIGPSTLDRLQQVWFAPTRAEVTGAPVVTADSLYFGDWSGRFYALDRATGAPRWTRDTPPHPTVYAGQSPASPTVTQRDGESVVVMTSGRTVWVLRTSDGSTVWSRELGTPADRDDASEIEGSAAVVDGLIVVPTDVHNDRTRRSGLVALALADGTDRWRWDPEEGKPPGGCGSLWGTPSIDVAARLVVIGTGSCFAEESWTTYSEAIVGLDLDTGKPKWSFQPRDHVGKEDWDFAGAANLFSIGSTPVAGLGNKDGRYYVVDRRDGKLVWNNEAVRQVEGSDGLAFGGFIGATSITRGTDGRPVVAGGTAVGDCPCQHAFDAASGRAAWQSGKPSGTYGASAAVPGLVFTGGIDQTLRAFDIRTGDVKWEHALDAISASGPAIAGDFMAIGVGFREPGSQVSPSGGVHGFRVLKPGEQPPPPSSSTTVPAGPAVTALQPSSQACVGTPCDVPFTLKQAPGGLSPKVTLEIQPNPLRVTVKSSGLGKPGDWLRADGPAAAKGASVFAAFVSPRDDKPELGSILCVLGTDGSCTTDRIVVPADSFTRISLLALADVNTPPTLQEGFDRLVTTQAFDPALVPAP